MTVIHALFLSTKGSRFSHINHRILWSLLQLETEAGMLKAVNHDDQPRYR
jgi:hypothetical protein